jgi:hypothetical protein
MKEKNRKSLLRVQRVSTYLSVFIDGCVLAWILLAFVTVITPWEEDSHAHNSCFRKKTRNLMLQFSRGSSVLVEKSNAALSSVISDSTLTRPHS